MELLLSQAYWKTKHTPAYIWGAVSWLWRALVFLHDNSLLDSLITLSVLHYIRTFPQLQGREQHVCNRCFTLMHHMCFGFQTSIFVGTYSRALSMSRDWILTLTTLHGLFIIHWAWALLFLYLNFVLKSAPLYLSTIEPFSNNPNMTFKRRGFLITRHFCTIFISFLR